MQFDAFISYKAEEYDQACWVKEVLESHSISCWMAPGSIAGGTSYATEIPHAIQNCRVFVLILSSKAQQSQWIPKEVDLALNARKPVLPFAIEDCALRDDFNFYLTNVQRYRAFENKSLAMEKMLSEINSLLGRGEPTAPKEKPSAPAPRPVSRDLPEKLEPGMVLFGRYEVVRFLDNHTFLDDYIVFDQRLQIEVLFRYIRKDDSKYCLPFLENVKNEIRVLRGLAHNGLPIVRDEFTTDTYYILVMDYIKGVPLASLIAENGRQKEADVIKWAIRLCETLTYLHNQDDPIIHRSICPRNILIKGNGKSVLVDFGDAKKLSETGCAISVGQSACLAPEMLSSCAADARSDIYSLGKTMYCALTGQTDGVWQITRSILHQAVPGLSEGIGIIIERCTQLDPKARYQTAEDLKYDLEHIGELTGRKKKRFRLPWQK